MDMKKLSIIMELPKKFGILQTVEFEYNQYSRQYEGVLTAEGCRRGVCLRYKVLVTSKNGSDWEPAKRRRSELDLGGCLKQAAADALMELANKYEVGIWYNYEPLYGGRMTLKDCGVVVNGVKLSRPYCRTVEDCVEEIIRDYKREVEKMRKPPEKGRDSDAEKLLREWPELEAFGTEWVREWVLYAKERMVQIAKVLRSHPSLKGLIEKVGKRENPYIIEVYLARNESEACVAFGYNEVFCAENGKVRKVPPDYVGQVSPRGLMAYMSKEFIRVL